jgi:Predicted metal-binding integral membrane protein (DUF2182)
MISEQASQRTFFGISALLFAASTAVTIVWCGSMSAMGEMPMPGGWSMSMTWMLMPGQTWLDTAASFLGMWVVMMVAMMLPSSVPMLWRYPPSRRLGKRGAPRLADGAGRHWVLLRLDPARNVRFSIRHGTGNNRDAITGAFARRSDRCQSGHPDWRRSAIHQVESTTTCLLSGVAWARLYITSGRRHSLATRPASRPPLQLLLCRPDSDFPRPRCHGPARDGCRNSGHHHRTPCPSR